MERVRRRRSLRSVCGMPDPPFAPFAAHSEGRTVLAQRQGQHGANENAEKELRIVLYCLL